MARNADEALVCECVGCEVLDKANRAKYEWREDIHDPSKHLNVWSSVL